MEDQVNPEFAVTNILPPIYPSSSPPQPFSGSPNNSSTESTAPPINITGGAVILNGETDDFVNDKQQEEEYGDDEDDYFNSFPPGYRFKPHDEELVVYYLRRKIYNQALPRNRIKEVELYKYNPDTLAANYKANGEDEWYFFTPRDRKYPNGDRPNRAAGDGYWKATGADKPIKFNKNKVGLKKSLVFYRGKPPRGDKTDWIMHEYKVLDAPKRRKISHDDMKLDDWVLCKIRKKDKPDKTAKAGSAGELQTEPPVPPANVSAIIPAVNNEEYDFVYSYNGIIPESLHLPFDQDQSSLYAQQMVGHNNFVPWIDGHTSNTFHHHTTQTPYDYLINVPPLQRLEGLGSLTPELDQLFHAMTDENDSKNNELQ